MELSHHTSDLDPSSVLGFGSALAMLDAPEEVARLLTGALRSMGLADLQAVVMEGAAEDGPRVYGSAGVRPLPEAVVDELSRWTTHASGQAGDDAGTPSHRQLDVPDESAVAEHGIDRLAVVRLGTLERDFGVAVAGLEEGTTHTPLQASSLQMMAAQVSMALHRIELDREQAAQETALRESEARYRELYENAPVAYLSATAEGEIRMANRRATELFDVSEAVLVGRSIPDFCAETPEGREAAQRLAKCLRNGEPVRDDEVALCLPDGDRIWVRLTMRPVEVGDGPRERLVMMVDVTERRRMDAALREARDELETRVEDRTAELERANERLEQQTHRLRALRELDQTILAAESPREIATETLRHTRQIIPFHRASVSVIEWDADRARVLATRQEEEFMGGGTTIPLDDFYLTDALRAGETEVIPDLAAQPRSGTAARVQNIGIRSVLCLPMMVEGTLIGLFKIGRTRPDAFEAEDRQVGSQLADHLAIALRQSQLLEKVQAQRERLEERVQERTAELESFTYSVSHDLRTPLRAIDGYTRILKEDHADQLDDEGRRLLNVVYDSAQTMGDLIDDLLTLSRLGRRDLTRAPTNMEALVHDTVGELRRAHPEIAADAFVLSPLPNAQADRSMIRHVLTNLLSNALKFTRPVDAPQIEVRGERQAKRCVYGVVDNGVGFDPNQADELFGVFQRGHADDEFEGTGVGLAVVDRIVRRHGGETWADGAKGDGASFFFTLPPAEAGRA